MMTVAPVHEIFFKGDVQNSSQVNVLPFIPPGTRGSFSQERMA
jgi:hypothetical protein